MTDADAIAEAAEFIACSLIDGTDLDVVAELVCDRPKVAALALDLALADMRNKMSPEERVAYARALRFSVLSKLSGLD